MSQSVPPTDAFQAEMRERQVELEPDELEKLGGYLARLIETTRQFNLTTVVEPDEAWMRHVFDSLTLLPLIASAEASSVCDVGSGGGLPGIPLAITLPEVRFTLVEATGKKAAFLQSVVAELDLANVTVVNDRAETIAHDRTAHREQYDVAVARAVGPLPVLLELTLPLVRVGGHVIAIKGARAPEEIDASVNALRQLHGELVSADRTPTGTLVLIQKVGRTPRTYPRRPGEPKRAPL